MLQIATNQGMSSGLFTFTEYPSNIDIKDDDNANVLVAPDGEGAVQYPYADVRQFNIIFEGLKKSVHDAGSGTLIYELKQRKFKTTGQTYYLRNQPDIEDVIASVVGTVATLTTGGLTNSEYVGYDMVDSSYNTFIITANSESTVTVDLESGTLATGVCYILDRNHNPIKQSAPLKVRILDVQEELVPNSIEAVYDYTIVCQKVV
jgi:hypothetical protein